MVQNNNNLFRMHFIRQKKMFGLFLQKFNILFKNKKQEEIFVRMLQQKLSSLVSTLILLNQLLAQVSKIAFMIQLSESLVIKLNENYKHQYLDRSIVIIVLVI